MKMAIHIISALLILLWIYTCYSKLSDIAKYKSGMQTQALPDWSKKFLLWILPVVELGAAIMLIFSATRLAGMYLSFVLMLVFTIYVAGAVLQLYSTYPCSCGGLFTKIGWKKHLQANIVLAIIALIGIVAMKYDRAA